MGELSLPTLIIYLIVLLMYIGLMLFSFSLAYFSWFRYEHLAVWVKKFSPLEEIQNGLLETTRARVFLRVASAVIFLGQLLITSPLLYLQFIVPNME